MENHAREGGKIAVRVSAALRLQLEAQAAQEQVTLSELCRRMLVRALAAEGAQQGLAPVIDALDMALTPWAERLEKQSFQTRFEMLRLTEKFVPWILELLITALYPEAKPPEIHAAIQDQSRLSRIKARAASKGSTPEYLRDLLDALADAEGLPKGTDDLK